MSRDCSLVQLQPDSSVWEELSEGSTFFLIKNDSELPTRFLSLTPGKMIMWTSVMLLLKQLLAYRWGYWFKNIIHQHCQILVMFTRGKSDFQFTDVGTYVSYFRFEWLFYVLFRSVFFFFLCSFQLIGAPPGSAWLMPCLALQGFLEEDWAKAQRSDFLRGMLFMIEIS